MVTRRIFCAVTAMAVAAPPIFAAPAPALETHVGVVMRMGLEDAITRAIVAHSPLPPERRRWSHAGLVIVRERVMVLHALPDLGVVLERWDDFLSQAQEVGFWVPPSPQGGRRALANASAWLGRKFDGRLRWQTPEATYCTRLVAQAIDPDYAWPRIRVPFYPDPVLHPDALAQQLPEVGWCPAAL